MHVCIQVHYLLCAFYFEKVNKYSEIIKEKSKKVSQIFLFKYALLIKEFTPFIYLLIYALLFYYLIFIICFFFVFFLFFFF